jgi:hypothetical protein
MKKKTLSENLKTPAFAELLIIGIITLILILLALTIDWTEDVVKFL